MSKLSAHFNNIAFSHSVFALPFAYLGAVLAQQGIPGWRDLFWITVAMVGARSAALALNNLIDLKYDKLHPRFTKRPMVTGVLTTRDAVFFILISLMAFLVAAANLQPLCLRLWPMALIPLAAYPYMKRFSWTCHLVLGLALAVAPVGGWVALRGDITWPIVLLGLAVGLWIAGFDVVYGCQDVEFDKEHQLHSMPVRFGIDGALRLAKILHIVSLFCFTAVGFLCQLYWVYYLGVFLAAGVLIYQHSLVSPHDFSQVRPAYFLRNGLVGMLMLAFTVLGVYLN